MELDSNEKTAGVNSLVALLGALGGGAKNANQLLKLYLAYAGLAGAAAGGLAGVGASLAKSDTPELESLKRRKRFYDSQTEEMKNMNWLNEVMTAKRKLETAKLSPEERKTVEEQYKGLIGA